MLDRILAGAPVFFLIMARMVGLFTQAPVFNHPSLPGVARISFIFWTAFLLYPTVGTLPNPVSAGNLMYGLLLLNELLIGFLLAFIIRLFFAAFITAGQMFSTQMGIGASQVFDALSQQEFPLLGQLLGQIGILLFLTMPGMMSRFFLTGVYHSFEAVPVATLIKTSPSYTVIIIKALAGMFESALQIAFPLLGILSIISVSMGLLGKAVPQMNLLITGLPIQIATGLIMLFIFIPFFVRFSNQFFLKIFDYTAQLLTVLKAGAGG